MHRRKLTRHTLKGFLLKAYVLFIQASGDPHSGKISFYLLHPSALENVVICLASVVFRIYNWMRLESKSWVLLCLVCFSSLTNKLFAAVSFPVTLDFFSSMVGSFYRWHVGPVEVASPPWKDQRQPLETERNRRLRDCQSMPVYVFTVFYLILIHQVQP